MNDIIKWWPIITFCGACIWWAATTEAKLQNLQSYIGSTAAHINNLDYNLNASK